MNLVKEFNAIMEEIQTEYPPSLFTDREFYADWLAQTYYFVCHSTSLLGYALPYLKNPTLKARFEKHIGEEDRHEFMAKKDLEKLGFSLEDFPEHAETQSLYQSQYYRIQFEGGTTLLGYILFLEGLAVHWGKPVMALIETLFKGSTVFVHVHATEDPHHLVEAIESVALLSQHEQELIRRNLRYSRDMYKHMLNAILAKKEMAKKKTA